MTEQQTIEEPNKGGRPSDFSEEVVTIICERMAEGKGLREICRDPDLPDRVTVLRWLDKHEEFRNQYARAREALMDWYAEEILEIAFDGSKDRTIDDAGNMRTDHEVVARSRLKVDTLKFLMAKLHPRRYGDKLTDEAETAKAVSVRWLAHEEALKELESEGPQRIERVIVASPGSAAALQARIEELEIELGRRERPPKLLTYDPGPLPASINPELLGAVVGLIRDCVPQADQRPADDVLREVLTIAGEALRAHYAKQNAA